MSSSKKSPRIFRIEELIKRNTWEIDKEEHIRILREEDLPAKTLAKLCPMRCYVLEEGRIVFHYEDCVECGLCRIVSKESSLYWSYPRGGKGIVYKRT